MCPPFAAPTSLNTHCASLYIHIHTPDISHLQHSPNTVWREEDGYASYSKAATKNWAAEETDTRFETESDMMELCDLAEIM